MARLGRRAAHRRRRSERRVPRAGVPDRHRARSVAAGSRRTAMAYEVTTPVFEGPFDLLLHLILREQVDLYEVSLAAHRRRLPGRARAHGGARPRRRHRVPAHRRHPGRAQGPPAAARTTTTSTSTTSWPCGRSATCCSPACSSARRSRTRPRVLRPPGRRGRPLATPASPGSRSASSTSRPTCWRASTPTTCGPPSCGPSTPKPVPTVDLDHVAAVRLSVADAVAELVDELPRVGRITFRRLTERAGRAARGRRALPGRARAVQAGPGRPRPGRRTSATSRSCGSATASDVAEPTSAGIDAYEG